MDSLEDQLARDESERQYAYDDANGKTLVKGGTLQGNLTIAIGRNLSAKGLSEKERAFLLANDIADADSFVTQNLPWAASLDPIRREVLVNMAFNMKEGLLEFHDFLGKLEANDYSGAAAAMLDSLWAKQVGARATRLSEQIQSGVRQ